MSSWWGSETVKTWGIRQSICHFDPAQSNWIFCRIQAKIGLFQSISDEFWTKEQLDRRLESERKMINELCLKLWKAQNLSYLTKTIPIKQFQPYFVSLSMSSPDTDPYSGERWKISCSCFSEPSSIVNFEKFHMKDGENEENSSKTHPNFCSWIHSLWKKWG